jgi:hypothetical protein
LFVFIDTFIFLFRKTCLLRRCYACGSNETYKYKDGREPWYLNHDLDDNVLCYKCYLRIISSKIYDPILKPKRILFKNKRIQLKFNPRKGICSLCGAIKGINCKTTSMHHIEYDDLDPLAHTIEVCTPCHDKIDYKIGRRYAPTNRSCYACGSYKTHCTGAQKQYPNWYRNDPTDLVLCMLCYLKFRPKSEPSITAFIST